MPSKTFRLRKLLTFVCSLLGLGIIFVFLSPLRSARARKWRLECFSIWSRWILRVFGIDVSENRFNRELHEGPRVIVANHVSYLDIPVLASLGPTLFLAKREVADWPLMGWLGKCLGMIYVDRTRLRSRAQAILDIQDQIRSGVSVVIFPEGTTSESGPQRGRVTYFAGAFRVARMEKVPVEIFYLDYEPLERCAWLGEDSFAAHLWNFLGLRRVRVRVRREWVSKIEHRHEQRATYQWSRQWMLEGGYGFMSVMNKGLWSLGLLGASLFCGHSQAQQVQDKAGWSGDAEVAVMLASGNTDLQSWNLKSGVKWALSDWAYELRGRYLRSEQLDVLSAEQYEATLRVSRALSERTEALIQSSYLRDRFRGLENQTLIDAGLAYKLIKTERTAWNLEAALGYFVEDRLPPTNVRDGLLRVQNNIEHKITEALTGTADLKYFTPWSNFSNWRSQAALGLETPINALFKVRTAYEIETQNQPPLGKVKNDQRLSVALLASF